MSLDKISPNEFDHIGSIKSEAQEDNDGVPGDFTETTHHANVKSARLNALRTGSGDQEEGLQVVGKERATWKIRREDRMTGANKITTRMFYEVDGVKHHITTIRTNGSRNILWLDTIAKDNE